MKKDIIIKYLRDNKKEFLSKYGVKKIGFFGSYARDENHDGSDLDVVVELEKPDMLYLIGIKQTLENQLGLEVDIVRIRDRMNQVLKKRIERDALYV